ncbi:dihydrofolate reductase family protein [Nocardia sp. CDC153]|uniref:dihydrofolate reductase family protein n=1 Tax=Nocardia sp. CDC153 TaxID=3112167 RepID=UPI002DB626AE|nr:dihydrofolate reductase family protein [Nocardia sp. CDC153]MEC3953334.1 dihydrofolate reductase family protein [Nocardia sp. CDC153]
MPKLRVHNLSVSLDGFVAGPDQGPDAPLGVGGERLHEWAFRTRYGHTMLGRDGGEIGADDELLAAGDHGIGATIMGRNMFGPVRGEWPDHSWTGWWGPNPPYHHDTFVLTHYPRPDLTMAGGTTFHFVADAPESVLKRAFDAADGADARLGGGASTVRQFLAAGLIDELHVAIVPTLLGSGERLFDNLGELPGYRVADMLATTSVTHVWMTKR